MRSYFIVVADPFVEEVLCVLKPLVQAVGRPERHRRAAHRTGQAHAEPFAERFNGSFRDECLNTHWFSTLPQARRIIAAWQHHYNVERPHASLDR